MEHTDKLDFGEMMRIVFSVYDKEFSSGVIDIYWNALSRFTLEDVRRAFDRHMSNKVSGKFFPKPADLLGMLEESDETTSVLAWTKVVSAIKRVGPHRDVVFDDKLIHAVISDMGGWVMLNNVTEKELPFKAREFETRYQGYKTAGNRISYPRMLTGIANLHNMAEGHYLQSPKLIGDIAAAQIVYQGGSSQTGPTISTMKQISNVKRLPGRDEDVA